MQALIQNNKVIQTAANKAGTFPVHPSLQWVRVPIGVQVGWDYDGATATAPIIALADAQATALQTMSHRYTIAAEQDVSYMGTTFQASNKSQQTLSRVLSVGAIPTGFFWIDAANNSVAMTYADLQGLAGSMLAQGQAAFIRLQTAKTAIKAAATAAAVQAVTW